MARHVKRNLLLALAAAAVLAGVVIAASGGGKGHGNAARATRSGSPAGAVQLAAAYIGIPADELRRRLRAGSSMAEVAEATPGRSAQGLVAALLAHGQAGGSAAKPGEAARARARIVAEINRARGHTGQLAVAAGYLHISVAALRGRLSAGASLARIADSLGRPRSGLVEALVRAKAARLRTAYLEHAITAREEKAALATLRGRVSASILRGRIAEAGE